MENQIFNTYIMLCRLGDISRLFLPVIHLVRTQNFPKNWYFLPPDTHTYVIRGRKYFLENFAYVPNEWCLMIFTNSHSLTWIVRRQLMEAVVQSVL